MNVSEDPGSAATSSARLVDIRTLARMLGVSVRHVERMEASGKLGPRPVRLGRSKRWLLTDIEEWLRGRCPNRDLWKSPRGQEGGEL